MKVFIVNQKVRFYDQSNWALGKIYYKYFAYKADIISDDGNRFKKLYNNGKSSLKKPLPRRNNIDNSSEDSLTGIFTGKLKR